MTARAAAAAKEKEADKPAKADDGMIYIELARTLHGWGNMGQTIQVSADDPEVAGLLDNELAVKVAAEDVPYTPEGLQEQPPLRFPAAVDTAEDPDTSNAE